MKVLFLSINNVWIPHFETELELMVKHLEKGDDVYIVTCSKSLERCSSNLDKKQIGCLKCRSRFCNGIKKIGISKKNIFFLNKKISKKLIKKIPLNFKDIYDLKKFRIEGIDFGLAVASSLISELNDHQPNTFFYREKIKKSIKVSLIIYESFLKIFKKLNPDLFYVFNGRFMEYRPAIQLAKKLNIDFYIHERGGTFESFSLFKNSLPHNLSNVKKMINKLWLDSNFSQFEKKKIAEKWFIGKRQGKEFSWLSHVKNQNRMLLPFDFDLSKKNIVIFNSSADEYETIPGWEEFIYENEDEALINIVKAFKKDKKVKFYLRIHPGLKNMSNTQIRNLKKLSSYGYKNLTIIWPEEKVDSYALLDVCDKAIVFKSTLGVEACFWRKPSILLGRALYEGLDCIYKPNCHNEVVNLINSDLKPKNKVEALKYGYWSMEKGIKFTKFKPESLFEGTFLGEKIEARLGLKDKLILKYYKYYNKLKKFKFIS